MQEQEPKENERERREFLGAGLGGVHCGKSKSVEAGKASIAGLKHWALWWTTLTFRGTNKCFSYKRAYEWRDGCGEKRIIEDYVSIDEGFSKTTHFLLVSLKFKNLKEIRILTKVLLIND